MSDAYGVAGDLQVGYGLGTATGGNEHAMFWQGTAASAFDLNSLLIGLGHDFIRSEAYDVNENGVIIGAAYANDGAFAVQWTPVPEPSALLLAALAVARLVCSGRMFAVRN